MRHVFEGGGAKIRDLLAIRFLAVDFLDHYRHHKGRHNRTGCGEPEREKTSDQSRSHHSHKAGFFRQLAHIDLDGVGGSVAAQ